MSEQQKMARAKAPAGGWYEQTPFGLAIPVKAGKFMPKESIPPETEAQVVKKERDNDFKCCLMAMVHPEMGNAVKQLRKQIARDWIVEFPKMPHVTLLYGFNLTGAMKKQVSEALRELPGDAHARVKKIRALGQPGAEKVPIVAELDCPELSNLNSKLKEAIPNQGSHPEFIPHVTIAYVKPEAVQDVLVLLKKPRIGSFEVDLSNLVLSTGRKKKYLIRLEK